MRVFTKTAIVSATLAMMINSVLAGDLQSRIGKHVELSDKEMAEVKGAGQYTDTYIAYAGYALGIAAAYASLSGAPLGRQYYFSTVQSYITYGQSYLDSAIYYYNRGL